MFSKLKIFANSGNSKRLLSNFFSLSLLQAFTYALPLLTMPYLVKVLGMEKFGLIMFAQSFIAIVNIFIDYGFNLSATREIAVNANNQEKTTEIFSSVLQIKALLLVLSFVVFSLIIFGFDKLSSDWEVYYLTFLMVVGQAFSPIWYFQGKESMKYITLINISTKIVFTVAIFIFIRSDTDFLIVPLLNGLAAIGSSIISLYLIRKTFNQSFQLQKSVVLYHYFKDSSQFFLSRVSVSIYTSANAFMLGIFTDTTVVGYYAIAEKLYIAIQGFYSPITQVLYPYVSKEKNINLFKKIFYLVCIINLVGLTLISVFSNIIFKVLFNQDPGSQSIEIFNILIISNVLTVPSILLGYPFLGALGFSKLANVSVIYGSIIHLTGLMLLILFQGVNIYNLAYMIIITELSVLIFRIIWSRKLWLNRI